MANEKRLIDANALLKRMFSYYNCVNEHTSKSTYRGDTLMDYEVADMIEYCIDDAPTVNAVKAVRCKDCRFCEIVDETQRYFCRKPLGAIGYIPVKPDDFCSYGEERKMEEK